MALSDAGGDTVQLYEYSVYGQVAASDPNHPNPFLFTGRRFDTDTGLYYYRARYYNPYIGRFLQTDPIGYGDGLNPYRYCLNSPLGSTDPSGLYTSLDEARIEYYSSSSDDGVLGYIYSEEWDGFYELTGGWNELGFYSIWHWWLDDPAYEIDGVPVWVRESTLVSDAEQEAYLDWFYNEPHNRNELVAGDSRWLGGPFAEELLASMVEASPDMRIPWAEPEPVSGPGPLKQVAGVIVGGIVVGVADGPSPVADAIYWGSAIYVGARSAKITTDVWARGRKKGSRTDKRKGSENRQPSGGRQRNVKHPNAEEHSIKPKGPHIPRPKPGPRYHENII
ncbi:MAG: RHS repeat-associated core domain-containing protein [Sedimentisphaerales bacterium]|nr:RHS repeat-associated core domain-containing protein [Sedimentisphaerales bacterium]